MLQLADILQRHARDRGDELAYRLLTHSAATDVTYAQLSERAGRIAGGLHARGLDHGRALLVYDDPIEYLISFFGCLLADAVPVTVKPFLHYRPAPSVAHLRAVVKDVAPSAILCAPQTAAAIRANAAAAPELADIPLVASAPEPPGAPSARRDHGAPRAGAPLAHIQYTSGSTGAPRGVMVSPSNMMDSLDDISNAFDVTPGSTLVSWLPHYHDMGLISGLLVPVYRGIRGLLLRPMEFIQRPLRWLEVIAESAATHSVATNSAYELCVATAAKRPPLDVDLSRWRLAAVAAEPIHPDTMDRFAKTFAHTRFSIRSFVAAYGLAEATLKVSSSRVGEGPSVTTLPGEREVVDCGRPAPNEVRIVDPVSRELRPDGEEGEIWIRGPTVGLGYWNRPEETEQTFRATLATGEGPFLRTGDLGLIHHQGLVITGRLKDLIILGGRNVYPQDIERTVEHCHAAIRFGGAAAFSTPGDEDRVVVVAEVSRSFRVSSMHAGPSEDFAGLAVDADELVRLIQSSVSEHHDVRLAAVALLQAGTLPRTSSGKIRRRACCAAFLDGTLKAIHLS